MKILILLISFNAFSYVCSYNFGNEEFEIYNTVSKEWKHDGLDYKVNITNFDSLDNYITISNSKRKITYQVTCSE